MHDVLQFILGVGGIGEVDMVRGQEFGNVRHVHHREKSDKELAGNEHLSVLQLIDNRPLALRNLQ